MTIKELEKLVAKLTARVENLEDELSTMKVKKGPASTREMTVEDAERIINGDLAETPHKKAAEVLGLSYGQVYSARGGYTFKNVVKRK